MIAKRDIPITSVGVIEFLKYAEVQGFKDLASLRTVLLGPESRVVGRRASGPTLARSSIGNVRMDRLTAHNFTTWFGERHPPHLAAATRKRGMSSMSTFLRYSKKRGWIDEEVLTACTTIRVSSGHRHWLHPEQEIAYTALAHRELDDYELFGYHTLLDCGLRPAEVPGLRAKYLNRRERTLMVIGKGPAEGKTRYVPVDDGYVERWGKHVERYGIKPDGAVWFSRATRWEGGSSRDFEWVNDLSKPATEKPLRRILATLRETGERAIAEDVRAHFELTPRVLRRTYACTQAILQSLGLGGLDLEELREAMGHESLDTTRVYLSDVAHYLRAIREPIGTTRGNELIVRRRAELLRDGGDVE